MPTGLLKPTMWGFDKGLVAPEWDWFWPAVKVALIQWEGAGKPFNYAARKFVTSMTADATWVPSVFGMVINWPDAATQAIDVALASDLELRNPSEISVVTRIRHTALASGDPEMYCSTRDAGNEGWTFGQTDRFGSLPDQIMKLAFTLQGVAEYKSTVNVRANDWNSLGFSWRNNDAVRFFNNGQFLDSVATGGHNQPLSTTRLFVANFGNGTVPFSGFGLNADQDYIYIFDRNLIDPEHAQLARDPFGPFRMEEDTPWLAIAAGEAPAGRIMASLIGAGGLAGRGGIAGAGGGLAA